MKHHNFFNLSAQRATTPQSNPLRPLKIALRSSVCRSIMSVIAGTCLLSFSSFAQPLLLNAVAQSSDKLTLNNPVSVQKPEYTNEEILPPRRREPSATVLTPSPANSSIKNTNNANNGSAQITSDNKENKENKDTLLKPKTAPPSRGLQSRLNLTPEERKIVSELFTSTLKPLALERVDYDMELLRQHKLCIEKSQSADQFKTCDSDFLQLRREKTEEIVKKIETKRSELEKKYAPKESKESKQKVSEHPFFKEFGGK